MISKFKQILFSLILLTLLVYGCSRLVFSDRTFTGKQTWPQLGGSSSRTNFSPKLLQLPLKLLWDRRASSTIGPTLVIADGLIFYGTLDGRIEAVEIETGKGAGRIKTKRDTESTCAYWRNSLVVIRRLGSSSLSLINLSTGSTAWQEKAGIILTEPLIVDDDIYVATLAGDLIKYEALRGTKKWTFKGRSQLHSSPSYGEGLIVFGNDAGEILALTAKDGVEKWRFPTRGVVMAPAMINLGRVYIGSTDNRFYALHSINGEKLWHFDTQGKIYNGAAAVDSLVIFGSTDHYIYCVHAVTGKLVWKFKAGSVVGTSPVIAGNVVFFGSLDHVLYALDVQSGKELWSFELEGRIRTTPVIANGHLIAASEDDFLYCFGPE